MMMTSAMILTAIVFPVLPVICKRNQRKPIWIMMTGKPIWMTRTGNSSLVYQPVMHCILHSIPVMSQRAIVPLQSITKVGKKVILWNQSLMVRNAMARSSLPMDCEIIFLSVIPSPGVEWGSCYFYMNYTPTPKQLLKR